MHDVKGLVVVEQDLPSVRRPSSCVLERRQSPRSDAMGTRTVDVDDEQGGVPTLALLGDLVVRPCRVVADEDEPPAVGRVVARAVIASEGLPGESLESTTIGGPDRIGAVPAGIDLAPAVARQPRRIRRPRVTGVEEV